MYVRYNIYVFDNRKQKLSFDFPDEIQELNDQLNEGGRAVHENDKARRRLEMEKEELQAALEEAEAALEQEEAKVSRAQLEIATIRQEIDKRIAEKEEEFENTRFVIKTTVQKGKFLKISI